mmetsp:Transcript_6657/g.22445  ORF Transcript_6657/g.22445 Transcript_6657/m.22445 type:complete len:326 (-) Transcript_6657:387-1364(-)
MPALSMMLKTFARKPYCPSIRVDTISNIVTFFFLTMLVSSQSVSPPGRVCPISVPGARTLYEFFTRTHRLALSMAGRMDCGCSTCAPKYASSVASWKLRNAMATVPCTSLGSALSTPSTSFHTYTSGSFSAAPITVAVRSLPPLPSVAIAPVFSPRPRNPVTTATEALAPVSSVSAFRTLSYVAGNTFPFSNSSVVTNPSWSNASYCFELSPIERTYEANILVLILSPKLTSVARVRPVHSCISATPVQTCSILFSNFKTSARVASSTCSASMVSTCNLRIAITGSSADTSSASSHFIASSPAINKLFVVLPIADNTTIGISSGN